MGKGRTLTVEERAKIDAMRSINKTYREIATETGRSICVISNYLKNKENYAKNRKGRTKQATTEAERRRILRAASNSTLTARQIKNLVGSDASVRTVQRLLKGSKIIKRLKIKRKPALTSRHMEQRINFGRTHMTWQDEWLRVVFTDEKKFNLDGPDGFQYYFHDLQKEEVFLSRRPKGGASVMIWGAISSRGPVDIKICDGHIDSKKYLEIVSDQRNKIIERLQRTDFIFQQDNAPCHSARIVQQWFREEEIDLLQWPALSPDLNIIENVWGWLSRRIYVSGHQYSNREDLIESIMLAWNSIPQDIINSLYQSLPNRIFEIIRNNGKYTHH